MHGGSQFAVMIQGATCVENTFCAGHSHQPSCFAQENVWLAGDAAHLTGPAGAQSMNVGLREAEEIALRIAEIPQGGGSRERVDSYNSQRLREWRRLLGEEGETRCPTEADDWLTEHRLDILTCLPASGDDLAQLLDQIGIQTDCDLSTAGA